MEQEKKKKLSLESVLLLTIGFIALGIVIIGYIAWILKLV